MNQWGDLLRLDARFREGSVLLKSPITIIQIVAATTTVTLWQVTTGRTAWLVGLMVYNANGASALLSIGTGDFTVRLPQILVLAGFNDVIAIPPTDFEGTDITIQSDVAAASPNEIEVTPYVLELAGS